MLTALLTASAVAPVVLPVNAETLWRATLIFAGFALALFVGAMVLPGRVVLGSPQPGGARKSYKMNGMALFVATHVAVAAGTKLFGLSLSPLYTHFWSLFIVSNAFSLAWSLALHVQGRAKQPVAERRRGAVGFVQDFWFGTELNPTWLGIDLKVWAYQPSLLGLALLNVAFAYVQHETYGSITPQMWLYQGIWWCYWATHFHYEPGLLSMWDVIAEKFGFMLVWGDLTLVPFFYSIGGWTLAHQRATLPAWALVAIAALSMLGLWIFRGSNAQKHRYKLDPTVKIWGKPAEAVGGRLLVSGWWGIGRKINYTGEITVYLSLALCTGFESPWPYALPVWLAVLLSHRAWRDEQRCAAKYGALWSEYCARAKFRMLPFVY